MKQDVFMCVAFVFQACVFNAAHSCLFHCLLKVNTRLTPPVSAFWSPCLIHVGTDNPWFAKQFVAAS